MVTEVRFSSASCQKTTFLSEAHRSMFCWLDWPMYCELEFNIPAGARLGRTGCLPVGVTGIKAEYRRTAHSEH